MLPFVCYVFFLFYFVAFLLLFLFILTIFAHNHLSLRCTTLLLTILMCIQNFIRIPHYGWRPTEIQELQPFSLSHILALALPRSKKSGIWNLVNINVYANFLSTYTIWLKTCSDFRIFTFFATAWSMKSWICQVCWLDLVMPKIFKIFPMV